MKLKLYGVMGSISGGNSDLGKNTTCLVIQDKENEIIIDAGTGIINLMAESTGKDHTILFTHYHLDHLLGIPFISEVYKKNQTFYIYDPELGESSIKDAIDSVVSGPSLPMSLDDLKSNLVTKRLEPDTEYVINNFNVKGYMVPHPGECMTYSIRKNGKKICILTDIPDGMDADKSFIEYCMNADILYIDSFFTEDELNNDILKTYGHASIESAIRILEKTKSKKLIIGHHKPTRKYKELMKYENEKITVGIEGMSIEL